MKSLATNITTMIASCFLLTVTFYACNPSSEKKPKAMNTNTTTNPSTTIAISVNKPKDEVYRFASNPENFPQWLAFVKSVAKKSEHVWKAETTAGTIEIELTHSNSYGIIDHIVTAADGSQVTNLLRVAQNGKGSEVIFTLFKLPGKTDAQFENDAKLVSADLNTLQKIMEKQ